MEKILIVSDSHGNQQLLMEIVQKNQTCDGYLHCGDSQLASIDPALERFVVVAGNTDTDARLRSLELINYGDWHVMLTHGHRYSVNWGLEELALSAKGYGCQIACFGHTHLPTVVKQAGVLCLNPGSIIQPRGDWEFGTYMLLYLPETSAKPLKIQLYHSRSHELVDEQIVHMA